MAQILSPTPIIGDPEGVAAAEVDATNLLQEIKNLLNGGVEADNLTTQFRATVNPPVASAIPGSPADGQRFSYSPGGGVLWTLRYNALSASPFKWEFVGGGEASFPFGGGGAVSVGANILPLGAQFVIPFAGDWDIRAGVSAARPSAPGSTTVQTGVFDGSPTPVFREILSSVYSSVPANVSPSGATRLGGLSKDAVVCHGASAIGDPATWLVGSAHMFVRPHRIG